MSEQALLLALPDFLNGIKCSEAWCRLMEPHNWCNSAECESALFEIYEWVGEHRTTNCEAAIDEIKSFCGLHFEDIRKAGFFRRIDGVMHVMLPSQLEVCECDLDSRLTQSSEVAR